MTAPPHDDRDLRTWTPRRTVVALTILLVLQIVVSAPWSLDVPVWLAAVCRPSPDLIALAALALLLRAAGRVRLGACTAGLLLWIVALLGQPIVLFPLIFQRPFELVDILQVQGLVHLLMQRWPVWQQALVLFAIVAALPLFVLAFARATTAVRHRRALHEPFTLFAAWLIFGMMPSLGWQPSTLLALGKCTQRAIVVWLDLDGSGARMQQAIDAGIERMQAAPHDLTGLRGVDVHVLFVESYGGVAWRHPALAARTERLWTQLDTDLRNRGFAASCGFVHPAFTGGGSWKAHQELFTGIRVPDQRTWDTVMTTNGPRLPQLFAATGRHTVEVMPAMPEPWPKGARFYGFAQSLMQPDLPYDGHVYTFGRMPDQVALLHLFERVVQPAERPLFTTFISVSSHSPWSETPRYLPDWTVRPGDFARPGIVHDVSWKQVPAGDELLPAYADSLDYALRTAVGYVARLPRPSLVLLLGDHQPPLSAVDVACPEDRRLDVPVHVISNRPGLLAPWREDGFVPGNDPRAAAGTWPLYELAPRLLRHYTQVR